MSSIVSFKHGAFSQPEWGVENSSLFIYRNVIQTQQIPSQCGGYLHSGIPDVNTIRNLA